MNPKAFTKEDYLKRDESLRISKNPLSILQDAKLDLTPAQEGQILDRLSEMPKMYRRAYLEAMKGKSPTAAIRAHCLECMGWSRNDIPGCTAGACALFPYRPFQGD